MSPLGVLETDAMASVIISNLVSDLREVGHTL